MLGLSVAFAMMTVDVTQPYAMIEFDQDVTTLQPVCFSITVMDYGAETERHFVAPSKTIYIAKQQNKNFERHYRF